MIDLEKHIVDFLNQKNQFFIFNKEGSILKSCNSLRDISEEYGDINIYDVFPFFESIKSEINSMKPEKSISYDCVGMRFKDLEGTFDISIKRFTEEKYVCSVETRTEQNKYWLNIQQERNEITIDKELIEKQAKIIEEQNENISDSIDYAKTIQNVILPNKKTIKRIFPKSFVIYKPKSTVSGDFYWITKIYDKTFWSTADATGHGVPGAILSMLGLTLINEAVLVKNIQTPSLILDRVRTRIISSLNQKKEVGGPFDGMDAAICSLDSNRILEFSGGQIPMILIRSKSDPELEIYNSKTDKKMKASPLLESDTHMLYEIRGDRQPVSQHYGETVDFTNNSFQAYQGDRVYCSSDGIRHQYGGPLNRKFTKKRIHQQLLSIQDLSMDKQGVVMEVVIEDWKGSGIQIDDICMFAIEVE